MQANAVAALSHALDVQNDQHASAMAQVGDHLRAIESAVLRQAEAAELLAEHVRSHGEAAETSSASRDLGFLRRLTCIAATRPQPHEPLLLFHTADEIISAELFERGQFEAEELAVSLSVTAPPEGSSFIDVGANIGTTTLALLYRGFSRGLALEPETQNVRMLRCNLMLNGLEELVVVRHAAAGEKSGYGTLELSPTNHGDHRLRVAAVADSEPLVDAMNESGRSVTEVPVVTLDEAAAEAAFRPHDLGLVWVDAQGYDARVLAGASELIEAGVPFVVECWPYGLDRANSLDLFVNLVSSRFGSFVDVREAVRTGTGKRRPAAEVADVVAALSGLAFTDLVLLPA